MSGGGTTSTNTIQNSDPWSGAQPYLTDLMSQAQRLYQKGASNAPFSTVAPMSPTTSLGLQLTQDRALNGSPTMDAANSALTQLLQSKTAPGSATLNSLLSGYSDPGQSFTRAGTGANTAVPLLNNLFGQNNAATGLATAQANGNPNANPANRYLSAEAATSSINPYLDSMFNAASKPVIDAVNAQFAQGGRTGSAANQTVLTRDLGDMASQMYGQNYQNAIQNQQNAANAIQGAYDNSLNRNLSATGLLGQLSTSDLSRNSDIANAMAALSESQAQRNLSAGSQLSSDAYNQAALRSNAANNLNSQFNTQNQQKLTAAGLAPSIANQDYTDLQNLLNVGGAYDTQANNQIQDLLSRFNFTQQEPWNLLQNYAGVVNGMGGLGGTQTTKGQVPTNNATSLIGAGGLLGSSLISSGLLSSLFAPAAATAGLGSAGGVAALGALAMSDRSAKTDIKRIGTYPNGLPKYSFRYRGSDVTHIGLMADDVEKVRPEAVISLVCGFKAVDYDLALAA